MPKLPFIVFGLFTLIFVLWTLNAWQSGNWEENLQSALPKIKEMGSIKSPELHLSASTNYKEFASPDSKFKMEYLDHWLVADNQGLYAATTPQDWQEKYGLQTIFLAQYFKLDKFAQLIVQEGIFDISNKKIVEEMKSINEGQGMNMEIVKSDTQDGKTVFEAKYSVTNSPSLYSKEEIVSAGDKTYLIAFITLESNWPEFAPEAEAILESIEVSP